MSIPMKLGDPAYWMLHDGVTTSPVVHSSDCYICSDPEFAQMGLPLCRKCPFCGGHVAADDSVCDDCERDESLLRHIKQLKDDDVSLSNIAEDKYVKRAGLKMADVARLLK